MTTAVIALVVLVITILAFVVRDTKATTMLHAMGFLGWLVLTYFLVSTTLSAFNVFVPTAAGLFGLSMVIVHLVSLVQTVLSGRSRPMTYDEEKAALRRRVYGLTKRKEKPPWERW